MTSSNHGTVRYGYKASAEQFPPRQLARLRHQLRSGTASTSSRSPTTSSRGATTVGMRPTRWSGWRRSGERTERVTLATSVLTPTLRYQPSVIAQAFATLACLNPGRVMLGIGTGEAMNENPVDRHRVAEVQGALRAPRRGGRADPPALDRGARHLRGQVLPDRARDDLRQARAAGADLHRRRRPEGGRAGRTRSATASSSPAARGRSSTTRCSTASQRAPEGRAATRPRSTSSSRSRSPTTMTPAFAKEACQAVGGARADRGGEGRHRGPDRDGAPCREPPPTAPTPASSSPTTRRRSSRRSPSTSVSASQDWSSTFPGRTRTARSTQFAADVLPVLRERWG